MNYLWLLCIAASLIVLELTLLFFKRYKDRKLKDKSVRKELDKGSHCQEREDCWCCKYKLSNEKKEEILKEFDELCCGKSIESIVNNK